LIRAIVFSGALLLFLVQPLVGRTALPILGGASQVWNTCLLFFQVTLWVGYGYAHVLAESVGKRTQIGVHFCLALATVFMLPLGLAHTPEPPLDLIISSFTPASLRTRMMNRRGGACRSLVRKLVRMRGPGSIVGIRNIARRFPESLLLVITLNNGLDSIMFGGTIGVASPENSRTHDFRIPQGLAPNQTSRFSVLLETTAFAEGNFITSP